MQLFLTTMQERHEGKLLSDYLRAKRIKHADLAERLGYTDRSAIYHYFKMQSIPAEFKDKLYKAGVLVFKEDFLQNQNYRAMYEETVAENVRLTKEIVRLQAELLAFLRKP